MCVRCFGGWFRFNGRYVVLVCMMVISVIIRFSECGKVIVMWVLGLVLRVCNCSVSVWLCCLSMVWLSLVVLKIMVGVLGWSVMLVFSSVVKGVLGSGWVVVLVFIMF